MIDSIKLSGARASRLAGYVVLSEDSAPTNDNYGMQLVHRVDIQIGLARAICLRKLEGEALKQPVVPSLAGGPHDWRTRGPHKIWAKARLSRRAVLRPQSYG